MRNSFSLRLVILQLVLKLFILPLFFIIIGDFEQRDVWRQHCNVKNLVIQTDPNKQAHLPPRPLRKVWNFFPSSCLGGRAAQVFVKWPHPSICQGDLLPVVWRAACGFLRVARVCTLSISGLQVILSSLTLELCFSKID